MVEKVIPDVSAALCPGRDCWRGGRTDTGVLEPLPECESYFNDNKNKACKSGGEL